MRQKKLSDYLLRFAVLLAVILLVLRLTCPSQTRIACVGDSITYGATIRDKSHDSYPAQLGTMLGRKYSVKNFGASGYTLQESCDRPYTSHKRYKKSLDFKPDVVLIMLGTNDTKERFGASAACIALGLKRLIAKAASTFDAWRTGRPNILVVTPKSIDKRYEATKVGKTMGMGCAEKSEGLAQEFEGIASQMGCHYLDANTVVTEQNHYDFMHLTKGGHQELADALTEVVSSLFI